MSGASADHTPRRQFDELVLLYQLEPEIRDVYVEGPTDVRLIRAFLEVHRVSYVKVYDIGCVLIPEPAFNKLGFTRPNRRGEVITLAAELIRELGPAMNQVTCIVDRDLDDTLGQRHSYDILLYTDFSCMESYGFTEMHLSRMLRFCGYRVEEHYRQIYSSMVQILAYTYCHRVANARLGWGLSRIELAKFLSMGHDGRIEYDVDLYRERLMNKNAHASESSDYNAAVNQALRELDVDPRAYVNGHDLFEVLYWLLIRTKCVTANAVDEIVKISFYCSFEFSVLVQFAMFKELLKRISTGTASPP